MNRRDFIKTLAVVSAACALPRESLAKVGAFVPPMLDTVDQVIGRMSALGSPMVGVIDSIGFYFENDFAPMNGEPGSMVRHSLVGQSVMLTIVVGDLTGAHPMPLDTLDSSWFRANGVDVFMARHALRWPEEWKFTVRSTCPTSIGGGGIGGGPGEPGLQITAVMQDPDGDRGSAKFSLKEESRYAE